MSKCARLSNGRGGLIFISLLLLLAPSVQAHPPAEVSLSYDPESQILNVTVTHTVNAPSNHYVMRVDVSRNGELVLSQDYKSQPIASRFTYSYQVNASEGDVLSAKATCSIAGSRTGELTVTGVTGAVEMGLWLM